MRNTRRRTTRAETADVPTVRHVAERAGVSTATVSRVLAGQNGVSEELSARVWQAARELNYQPNRIARNLRSGATRTVGVVIPNIENPFFTSVVRGIEGVLQAADYTLLLGNSDERPEREQLYLSTLRAEGVAGIIFVPIDSRADAYRQLIDAALPVVAIDRAPAALSADYVTADNVAGARAAVEHLIRFGHRRVGLITGPEGYSSATERRAGYEQALAAAGLPVLPELIHHGDFRESGGYRAMGELLSLPEPPHAVFAANNLMTLGALRMIHERGLRIPDEMAVVSFDDMPWAISLHPPLTAVAQPAHEMGASAAELLLTRIQKPDRPARRITLQTELVVRASCGSGLPRGDQHANPDPA
jgi:LacI family transcriptional regulator